MPLSMLLSLFNHPLLNNLYMCDMFHVFCLIISYEYDAQY